jgi:hypothetical protein
VEACLRSLAALLLVVAAGASTSPRALAAALAEGAIAPADLLAPVDVQVTPLVGGGALATRDGQLLPAIVRADPGAADAAIREFDAAFARARVAFLDEVERAFGARVVDETRIGSMRFQSLRSEFVAAHPEFPVGYVLAAAWARGDDGELVRARMAGVLRQVTARQLIGAVPKAATVFVLAMPQDQLVRAWSEASPALVRAVDRADVVSLETARAELWSHLGVSERFAGGYLETLVRENIRYDARLTALFLHERLGAALDGRFFGRGDVIVRGGEPVDAAAAEALRQLDALGLAPLMAVVAPAPAAPEPRPVVAASVAAPAAAPVPAAGGDAPVAAVALPAAWIAAVAVLGGLSLAAGVWGFHKLRKLGRVTVAGPAPAAGDMREVLAREMTRQGMDALFTQRQELLATTAVATERMEEMETRVAKVQPVIQERMRSYERRIKALERELQEK